MGMSIAVSLPLTLDCVLDIMYMKLTYVQAPWIVFALLVPNSIQLLVGALSDDYPCYLIREVILSATLISFLFHSGRSIKTTKTSLIMGNCHIMSYFLVWFQKCQIGGDWTLNLARVFLCATMLATVFFVANVVREYDAKKEHLFTDILASSLFVINTTAKLLIVLLSTCSSAPWPACCPAGRPDTRI